MKTICACFAACLAASGCTETVPVLESLVPESGGAIHGHLAGGAAGDEGMRAAVIWNHYGEVPESEEIAAESAALDADPTGAFTMSLTPPSEVVLAGSVLEGGGARFGYGLIVALRDDASLALFDRIEGAARDHVIVYADDDMDPVTETGRFLSGRLAEGMHLMHVVRGALDCFGDENEARCYPFRLEPASADTEVEITLGLAALIAVPSP